MSGAKRPVEGEARLERARREQLELVPTNLDDLIGADHPARAIWGLVAKLDLSKFVEDCKSRGENAGRPAIDPAILVTLWIFAASQGIGSSRELARLTKEHAAYHWIRGQVDVSYHTLSDFRIDRALAELPKVREKKTAEKRPDARVSSTDPEARIMRMPDGGWRPAFNVQLGNTSWMADSWSKKIWNLLPRSA